nr:terpene cyclase/mutase family protein [Candidatus Njordarchaeota archaeon]
MENWKKQLNKDPIDWLLSGEPWTVYRTLVDLQGLEGTDRQVTVARENIFKHEQIRRILHRRNRDGYWGVPKDIHTWWPRRDTTFWLLPVLADFGFTVGDEKIANACEYVFSTQLESGGFGWDPPDKPGDCHTAIIVESLAKLGLLKDPRLQKAYDYLVKRQRIDGGFWCKNTGQIGGPREKEPSCALAAIFVLGALAQNPKLRNSETADKGADFLFQCWENRGKVKYAGHDSKIGTDWEKLKYPFTDCKILKFLDVLSQFEFAKSRLRESEMLGLLLRKQNDNGRFTPESIIKVWSDFDFGQKEVPSRWITLLCLRILKRVLE